MSDIEARRAANRAAFPEVARIVDEFRSAFRLEMVDDNGNQVSMDTITVQFGEEAGNSFGKLIDPPQDSPSVFSGSRLLLRAEYYPIETYREYRMGMKR